MHQLHINPNDKVLVVAPHPDDETIGCGGLLCTYGSQCDVLLVTDGRMGFFPTSTVQDPESIAAIREKEFSDVMQALHIRKTYYLRIPNENMKPYIRKIKQFDLRQYTKIFIPNAHEAHKEHKTVNRILRKMILKQWSSAKVYEYEVWTPIRDPDYLLPIGDVMKKKLAAVALYKSQIECYDYVRITEGINLFRGCTLLTRYAEVYQQRKTIKNILKSFYRKLKCRL